MTCSTRWAGGAQPSGTSSPLLWMIFVIRFILSCCPKYGFVPLFGTSYTYEWYKGNYKWFLSYPSMIGIWNHFTISITYLMRFLFNFFQICRRNKIKICIARSVYQQLPSRLICIDHTIATNAKTSKYSAGEYGEIDNMHVSFRWWVWWNKWHAWEFPLLSMVKSLTCAFPLVSMKKSMTCEFPLLSMVVG